MAGQLPQVTCYELKNVEPKIEPGERTAVDLFGELTLDLKKPRRLGVSSASF